MTTKDRKGKRGAHGRADPTMVLSELASRFAGGTTMHGIPKAIRARSPVGRLFWSIVCLAAASMFCMQFIQLLQKYYSYPKKVTIEVVPSAVPFPSISLCNMRNLDTMVLNTLNRIFKEASDPLDWTNYTSDPFINEYMNVVARYYPMFIKNGSNIPVFQMVLTRTTIATNLGPELVSSAGVPFKELIVTCRFGGHDCNRTRDFSQFFDPYYYNCFTYNAPVPDDPDSILAEGLENGWSTTVLTGSGMMDQNQRVRMIPGSHEYMSPMSSSEGVRLVIHPRNSEPYPHTEGFDVPPGYSVSFGVKARENQRIGPPHGNCSNTNPFGDKKLVYRLISCQKKCLQRAIVNRCGCKDISLPGHEDYDDVKFCNDDTNVPRRCRYSADEECENELYKLYGRIVCVRNTTVKVTRSATATRECGCFPPCQEVTYDVSYSISKWPAESFDGDEAYRDIFYTEGYPMRFMGDEDQSKFNMYGEYFDEFNRKRAMKDFSRLNVYIAESNVLRTQEGEDYSQSQLLSDIGGQLGLWVGISVITLAEVLELFMDICGYFGRRHGPYSQGKSFSKDPADSENLRMCRSCRVNGLPANGSIPLTSGEDPGHMV